MAATNYYFVLIDNYMSNKIITSVQKNCEILKYSRLFYQDTRYVFNLLLCNQEPKPEDS